MVDSESTIAAPVITVSRLREVHVSLSYPSHYAHPQRLVERIVRLMHW
jgi:hypothetical protein